MSDQFKGATKTEIESPCDGGIYDKNKGNADQMPTKVWPSSTKSVMGTGDKVAVEGPGSEGLYHRKK